MNIFTYVFQQFIHTFSLLKEGFEQVFLALSTTTGVGYYYYLYIDKTRSQANSTKFLSKIGVSNYLNVMKDFQLKKMRATT
jgi:hypothetical protein